ncbi:MAG: bifunctional proline dehydrogenase/L-glutamate gamma-semialdehyde dehydrogenase PutA [Steroidobacteraceae bacterium]|jgi:RHH-type proline utilization regulon transcriptional repressor/proline dehydrogenase/delta 1-pyrroline-5-carboxylate dehydrogenase|nr:bifunctional proline dehydrogenase/L-glutamate gamma-semialdehyde dehydrogenase PutA [Steroidobacteraceae bacterium]
MGNFLWPPDAPAAASFGPEINRAWLADETAVVQQLLPLARLDDAGRAAVEREAVTLVQAVRAARRGAAGIEAFLQQYDLGSREGVILMCIAEALLRIPDADTADRLIADKISGGRWEDHLGAADSLFVNASTWGLMLTGRLVRPESADLADPGSFIRRLAGRLGEPVVRAAFRQAMKIMGHQFVMGRTIGEALKRASTGSERRYRHTFDMLGESALTLRDADRYFEAYCAAIQAVAGITRPGEAPEAAPSISVKLSALHPRYEYAQRAAVLGRLGPQLESLATQAMQAGVALTIDAEEADRLELQLELLDRLLAAPALAGYGGLGLAVQAYQKRAPDVLRWLAHRADETGMQVNVRLVKGAYWDAEIKRGQERGHPGYPVFTRKPNTDVCYLACARLLLTGTRRLYPQFASHNAHTVAWVSHVARENGRAFEFQRLHGMGEELYDGLKDEQGEPLPCRVYAPVGSHEDLLPYLVRRLLENGANTSFVNRIVDESVPAAAVVRDPVLEVESFEAIPHPRIPLPAALFGAERKNSAGLNLADPAEQAKLAAACAAAAAKPWRAAPVVGGRERAGTARRLVNPARIEELVGEVLEADGSLVGEALSLARAAQPAWDRRPAAQRAAILEKAAEAFEANTGLLVALCVREAGKTVPDSIAELREAVDFLRYYAARAREEFAKPLPLPGPTGESNALELHGRGVFGCISPWNFPLAIFTGQVAAALVAGNAVLAKPAEQTPLVAAVAVRLLHAAGVPGDVLHFLPGDGATVGARMTSDPRLDGVAFTGSTETARLIARALAARDAPLATLIAETGGQNAMIVDSSALLEQVVHDAITSAFNAAGQRCSALRVLFLQEDIADRALGLLAGAMDLLNLGDPALLSTDVGPVIDPEARAVLEAHAARIVQGARWHHRVALGPGHAGGHFVAPLAVEIPGIGSLTREVFGPILHVVRYRADDIDAVIDSINGTGYGLTLGVHSRIEGFVRRVAQRAAVGNVYVNRNMIGAVVGVQPFGGCGLSGTGPKAGGPRYLHRFATERTVTNNTVAMGGNAALLSLGD